MSELHIPVFRFGKTYESLDVTELTDFQGKETFAKVSQANAGIIRRDMKKIQKPFDILQQKTTAEMLDICARTADLFMDGDLPISGGDTQSPDDYRRILSASCGLPLSLVKGNMEKICFVLREMPSILKGLTRDLDLSILDKGMATQHDLLLSFFPSTHSLGAVLPSNSPGVNSLWLPALAMRIPVVLKPGREDPWTPWRIIQAFIAAGCPPEAFGFYPTSHEGSAEVLNQCGRALVFGDKSTVDRYAGNPAISAHGPGWSKVIIGEDKIDQWEDYIDLIVQSIALNGGRSCVNASSIVVPRHGEAIARAVAEKLTAIKPRPLDDPDARISAFVNPRMIDYIDQTIDQALEEPGATELTAELRNSPRREVVDGASFLHPTLVYCSNNEHPLAKTEFLLPFASVVEVPQSDVLEWIGPTLVCSAITDDPDFRKDLLACSDIDRLNLGALSTPTVKWDQPHEGNLFEFLYKRRAIQQAAS